ncbi:MAG: hypothetical protein OWR62_15535 [Sulfobacillus thermotolerans]|nr:hypothetical protein [Sulfobacillus thermotolerans]
MINMVPELSEVPTRQGKAGPVHKDRSPGRFAQMVRTNKAPQKKAAAFHVPVAVDVKAKRVLVKMVKEDYSARVGINHEKRPKAKSNASSHPHSSKASPKTSSLSSDDTKNKHPKTKKAQDLTMSLPVPTLPLPGGGPSDANVPGHHTKEPKRLDTVAASSPMQAKTTTTPLRRESLPLHMQVTRGQKQSSDEAISMPQTPGRLIYRAQTKGGNHTVVSHGASRTVSKQEAPSGKDLTSPIVLGMESFAKHVVAKPSTFQAVHRAVNQGALEPHPAKGWVIRPIHWKGAGASSSKWLVTVPKNPEPLVITLTALHNAWKVDFQVASPNWAGTIAQAFSPGQTVTANAVPVQQVSVFLGQSSTGQNGSQSGSETQGRDGYDLVRRSPSVGAASPWGPAAMSLDGIDYRA